MAQKIANIAKMQEPIRSDGFLKNDSFSKMAKIGHYAKGIAFAKLSVLVEN